MITINTSFSKKLVIKMAFSAIIMALCIVFMKVIPIEIPGLPFLRISLGPALIIFGSILLGPVWGMLIGAGADALGFLLDRSGFLYMPGITILYGLLGFCAWFVFKAFMIIKNKQTLNVVFLMAIFMIVFVTISSIFRTDSFRYSGIEYEFTASVKWIASSIVFGLAVILSLFVLLFSRWHQKRNGTSLNVVRIALVSMVLEVVLITIFGAFVKSVQFGMDFRVVVLIQSLLFFINVPVNTFMIVVLHRVVPRFA